MLDTFLLGLWQRRLDDLQYLFSLSILSNGKVDVR